MEREAVYAALETISKANIEMLKQLAKHFELDEQEVLHFARKHVTAYIDDCIKD